MQDLSGKRVEKEILSLWHSSIKTRKTDNKQASKRNWSVLFDSLDLAKTMSLALGGQSHHWGIGHCRNLTTRNLEEANAILSPKPAKDKVRMWAPAAHPHTLSLNIWLTHTQHWLCIQYTGKCAVFTRLGSATANHGTSSHLTFSLLPYTTDQTCCNLQDVNN